MKQNVAWANMSAYASAELGRHLVTSGGFKGLRETCAVALLWYVH